MLKLSKDFYIRRGKKLFSPVCKHPDGHTFRPSQTFESINAAKRASRALIARGEQVQVEK